MNPLLSLINHSCDSNYGRVWVHDRSSSGGSSALLVRAYATRPIAAGEEVTDCYSATFSAASKERRAPVHKRLALTIMGQAICQAQNFFRARYLFCCQCPACRHDWPTGEGLLHKVRGLPKAAYLAQSTPKRLSRLATLQSRLSSSSSSFPQAVPFLQELVSLSCQCLHKPHRIHCQAEEALHLALRERDRINSTKH